MFAVLNLAAPAAALAHPGRVPHIHPHEAPLIVALVLVLGVAVAAIRALARRSV